MTAAYRGGERDAIPAIWLRPPSPIFDAARGNVRLWSRLQEVVGRHTWRELDNAVMWRILRSPQTARNCSDVESSTLLIVGGVEMRAFTRAAAILSRWIPSAGIARMRNAGHLSILEDTIEAADIISKFYQRIARPVADRDQSEKHGTVSTCHASTVGP